MNQTHDLDSFYKLLGVKKNCSNRQLKKARAKLLHKYHPDKSGANQESLRITREIIVAYEEIKKHRVDVPPEDSDKQSQKGNPVEPAATPKADPEASPDIEPEASPDIEPEVESEGDPSSENGETSKHPNSDQWFLGRVVEKKEKFRIAWNEYQADKNDIANILRLISAAISAGRQESVLGLLQNPLYIDAASSLYTLLNDSEAYETLRGWAIALNDRGKALQAAKLLEMIPEKGGDIPNLLYEIYYCLAQGYYGGGKPSPGNRIEYLKKVLTLGDDYELGYIYKLIGVAYYELGDIIQARIYIVKAYNIDPGLCGKKKWSGIVNKPLSTYRETQTGENATKKLQTHERAKKATETKRYPSVEQVHKWEQSGDWDSIFKFASLENISPKEYSAARASLNEVAIILGESNDCRAVSTLIKLFQVVYRDIKEEAFLGLAKCTDRATLTGLVESALSKSRCDVNSSDYYIRNQVESSGFSPVVEYIRCRLENKIIKTHSIESSLDLIEKERSSNSIKSEVSFYSGWGRFQLENLATHVSGDDPQYLRMTLLLGKECNEMGDFEHARRLLRSLSDKITYGHELYMEFIVNYALACSQRHRVREAISMIQPIFHDIPEYLHFKVERIMSHVFDNITPEDENNILWVLDIYYSQVLKSKDIIGALRVLHKIKRAMEPIGERDAALWIRNLIRTEAADTYCADAHDRRRYFAVFIKSENLRSKLNKLYETMHPMVQNKLIELLGSQKVFSLCGKMNGSNKSVIKI